VSVKFLASLLRTFSFVFHLTLSTFLLATAAIAYRAHDSILSLSVPFPDQYAVRDITVIGICGLLFSMLALTRRFKFFFVLWTLVLFYVMLKSFFLGPFAVWGTDQQKGAAWLTFGALGAFFGAAWAMKFTYRKGLF
jgi:hypothetical protein